MSTWSDFTTHFYGIDSKAKDEELSVRRVNTNNYSYPKMIIDYFPILEEVTDFELEIIKQRNLKVISWAITDPSSISLSATIVKLSPHSVYISLVYLDVSTIRTKNLVGYTGVEYKNSKKTP